MSKFKKALVFTSGEVLKTRKGELTDWTFISESHSNSTTGRRYVNARCKCGKEKVICINNVRCGNSTCCGFSPCRGTERKKDAEVGYKAILYVYKKHAKDRGFTFDLDYKYFKELTLGAEIFNIFDVQNSISNTFVRDVYTKVQYSIPNYLSPRVFNVRLTAKF